MFASQRKVSYVLEMSIVLCINFSLNTVNHKNICTSLFVRTTDIVFRKNFKILVDDDSRWYKFESFHVRNSQLQKDGIV